MLTTPFRLSEVEVRAGQVRLAMVCQSCPIYSRHPDFCILKDVAELKPAEQIRFVQNLPVEDLRFALSYHEVCMSHELDKVWQDLLRK